MNTRSGLTFIIAIGLLLTTLNGYSQDTTKAAQPTVKKADPNAIKKQPAKTIIPPAIKPPVQVPAQQAPATNQTLPAVTPPAVIDNTLEGQYKDLASHTYSYHLTALTAYHKRVMDSLNTEKRKFREAQTRLAAQAKVIAGLQNNVNSKDQDLTQTQANLNQVSLLGIPLSKTLFTSIMLGLVLILAIALITVIYLSKSSRNEAAYRIKLFEELEEEFRAYKVKANEKEKKLARELQTERNKVDELTGKK
jgi:hypothetical protein